jgi:hypothetical protein
MEHFLDRDVNTALKNVFSHDAYTTWLQNQAKTQRIKAGLPKKIVFDSSLRTKAKVLVKLLSPVMQVLRLFDRGMPVMGFVYYAVADMCEKSAKIMSDHKLPSQVQKVVLQIIDDQWESFATDMHAAAYLLNPRYWHLLGDPLDDKELKRLSPNADAAAMALTQFTQIMQASVEISTVQSSQLPRRMTALLRMLFGICMVTMYQSCSTWPLKSWQHAPKQLSASAIGKTCLPRTRPNATD